MPIISAIFYFLTGWFARILGASAARALVFKSLLYILFVSVLPTVLYNLFNSILSELLALVSSSGITYEPLTVSFTGFAGWLAVHLKIPEAFSVLLSAFAFRVTISFIPFINKV